MSVAALTPDYEDGARAMREACAKYIEEWAQWPPRLAAGVRALPLPTPAAGGRCGYFIEQDETCKLPYPHPGQEHNSRPTPAAGESERDVGRAEGLHAGAALLTALKRECEKQHARAEAAEQRADAERRVIEAAMRVLGWAEESMTNRHSEKSIWSRAIIAELKPPLDALRAAQAPPSA